MFLIHLLSFLILFNFGDTAPHRKGTILSVGENAHFHLGKKFCSGISFITVQNCHKMLWLHPLDPTGAQLSSVRPPSEPLGATTAFIFGS